MARAGKKERGKDWSEQEQGSHVLSCQSTVFRSFFLSLSFSLRLSLCLTSPHLAYHFVFSIAIDLLLLAPLSCGRSYYNTTTTPKLQIVKSGGRERSYMSLFQTLFMSRCVVRLLRRPFR